MGPKSHRNLWDDNTGSRVRQISTHVQSLAAKWDRIVCSLKIRLDGSKAIACWCKTIFHEKSYSIMNPCIYDCIKPQIIGLFLWLLLQNWTFSPWFMVWVLIESQNSATRVTQANEKFVKLLNPRIFHEKSYINTVVPKMNPYSAWSIRAWVSTGAAGAWHPRILRFLILTGTRRAHSM